MTWVSPQRDDDPDPMVRIPVELVGDDLAGVVGVVETEIVDEPDVPVQVDERRHHSLAGQVDDRRTFRNRDVGGQSHVGDHTLIDHQHSSPQRRTAVTRNQSGALVGDDGADWFFRDAAGAGGESADDSKDRRSE